MSTEPLEGYLNVQVNRASLSALPGVLQHLASFEAPILFVADKDDLCFRELQPLVDALDYLASINKHFLLLGLPYCVLQHAFGGNRFNKYRARVICNIAGIPSLDLLVTKYIVLLDSCRDCIAIDNCVGLGRLESNSRRWGFRLNSLARFDLMKNPGFESADTKSHYEKFLLHISMHSQYYVDRTLRYASVFPISGVPSYRERFTYFCRYLIPEEASDEAAFITAVARKSSPGLLQLKRLLAGKRITGYAYSYAGAGPRGSGITERESYYFYFLSEHDVTLFAAEIGIPLPDLPKDLVLSYVGLDSGGDQDGQSKLYYSTSDDAAFIERLKVDFGLPGWESIMQDTFLYFYAIRYSPDNTVTSEKFEFCVAPRHFYDIADFIRATTGLSVESDVALVPEIVALDFRERSIRKATVYYAATVSETTDVGMFSEQSGAKVG